MFDAFLLKLISGENDVRCSTTWSKASWTFQDKRGEYPFLLAYWAKVLWKACGTQPFSLSHLDPFNWYWDIKVASTQSWRTGASKQTPDIRWWIFAMILTPTRALKRDLKSNHVTTWCLPSVYFFNCFLDLNNNSGVVNHLIKNNILREIVDYKFINN